MLSGLTSSLLRDFEDSAHQPKFEVEDDGARLVKSHGLAFVPCTTTEIVLEQGLRAPITEVIYRVFASFRIQDHTFDPALNWMQASFTAQADGIHAEHIHTRRETHRVEFAAGSYWGNALLGHLRSAFLGHFLPKPGINADQK